MTPGQGRNAGEAYLSRDFDILGGNTGGPDVEGTAATRDIRGSLSSGDPSESSRGGSDALRRPQLQGNWRDRGVETWTDSNQQNVAMSTRVPWVERNGQVGWKTVDSGATAQNIDSTFAGGSKSPIRVDDYTVVEPDSTQTSETFAEISGGQLLRQLRDEAKTQVVPRSALSYAKNPTPYGNNAEPRARVAPPDERTGTLVGSLRQGGVDKPVYAPDNVTYTRTVPTGDYGSTEVKEQGFRVGSPLHRDYDGPNSVRQRVVEPLEPGTRDVSSNDVRGPLFPGMGFQPAQKPVRVYPDVLDNLQGKGAGFFVPSGPKGELTQVASWQEALALSPERESGVVVAAVQHPVQGLIPLRAVVQPDSAPVLLLGGDAGGYNYTGPAIFSPDRNQRRKGEAMAGSANEQIAELIANAASGPMDIQVGMPGVQAVITRALQEHPNPEALKAALLQSAKTKTQLEATLQGIAGARPGQEVDLFSEAAIADSLAPAPSGISVWRRDAQGNAPAIRSATPDADYDAYAAAGINPDVAEALAEEARLGLPRNSSPSNDVNPDSYEQLQGAYGDFGESLGSTKTTISPAELALEPGSPMKPFVEYAMNVLGDGDPNRAYELAETALRGTRPRAPGQPLNEMDVFNAIHELTGQTVGSGSMSKGRQIYADRLRSQYQATAPGMREFNYPAYAEVLSNPENPHFEKAMAFAAERIRRLREAAAQG
jgi:hypothetical protein